MILGLHSYHQRVAHHPVALPTNHLFPGQGCHLSRLLKINSQFEGHQVSHNCPSGLKVGQIPKTLRLRKKPIRKIRTTWITLQLTNPQGIQADLLRVLTDMTSMVTEGPTMGLQDPTMTTIPTRQGNLRRTDPSNRILYQ